MSLYPLQWRYYGRTAKEFHSKLQINAAPDENDNASFIMLAMRRPIVALLEARNVTHVVNVHAVTNDDSIIFDIDGSNEIARLLKEMYCGCLVSP